ncbi:MAG TPA: hypothetical protein VFX59_04570 [Polyangiales bacterium]|nr:hypothetical protein [Polyangiales bacterium]
MTNQTPTRELSIDELEQVMGAGSAADTLSISQLIIKAQIEAHGTQSAMGAGLLDSVAGSLASLWR